MVAIGRLLRCCRTLLLTPAADPRVGWEDAERQHDRLVEQTRQAQQVITDSLARMEERAERGRTFLAALEEHARQAALAGHDDLARSALRQRRMALANQARVESQIDIQQREQRRLAMIERQLAAAIADWNIRREMAGAQLNAVETRAGIEDSLARLAFEMSDLETVLHGADTTIDHLSARAAAIEQLSSSGALGVADDGATDPDIEAELARLRRHN